MIRVFWLAGLIAAVVGGGQVWASPDPLVRDLEQGWNLVAVPREASVAPEDGALNPGSVWRVVSLSERDSDFPVSARAAQSLESGGIYWIHVDEARRLVLGWGRTGAPTEGIAGALRPDSIEGAVWPARSGWGFFSVFAPTVYDGSQGDEVMGWDVTTQAFTGIPHGDRLEPGLGYFGWVNAAAPQLPAVTPPGVFEPAQVLVSPRDGRIALVDAALSEGQSAETAHVVYVLRGQGDGRGDEVHYVRNPLAGKPGHFSPSVSMAQVQTPWMVTELSVAARGGRVTVAWVEHSGGSEETPTNNPRARVMLAESFDGGRSFAGRQVVRQTSAWVRGLEMDYDAWLGRHLVFGEAHKAYYLKNLEGPPENVFDVRKRDSRIRTETHEVGPPSLHVGDEAVTIVVRQQRMWDSRAVGTWHTEDAIKVAQRPLISGAWRSRTEGGAETGWAQGRWIGDTFQSWRIAQVAAVGRGPGDDAPSLPQVVGTPLGLAVVYEDGVSKNPNQPGQNPIVLQNSKDGGQSWAPPRILSRGYVPKLAWADGQDMTLLHYVPSSALGGSVVVLRSGDGGQSFGPAETVSEGVAKPIHWSGHGADGGTLDGRGSLVSHGDLFFAAWVEYAPTAGGGERIMMSRASRASSVVRYGIDLPSHLTRGRVVSFTVSQENVHHMRVDGGGTARGAHAPASTGPGAPGVFTASKSGTDLAFVSGLATVYADPEKSALLVGPGGHVRLVASDGVGSAPKQAGEEVIPLLREDAEVPVFSAAAEGNYQKAKWMRASLWRAPYQVEYTLDSQGPPSRGQVDDAKTLAAFERVWAYTQGIALAQYAREGTPESATRAQVLAEALCQQAHRGTHGGKTVIKGWPFSWNTRGDSWRDVRLVTGATAWVIHGLGAFLISEASQNVPALRAKITQCYRDALLGLEVHRWSGATGDGRAVSLMTAGWTAIGLNHAPDPLNIVFDDGRRAGIEGEAWDYYDVLDALGYTKFNETSPPVIKRTYATLGSDAFSPAPKSDKILSPVEFVALKKEMRAQNVVTEHNVDVLSVLKQALNHTEALGLSNVAHLQAWRDQIRDGLFYVLWDQEASRWRRDLNDALLRASSKSDKAVQIQAALQEGDWGRAATGGLLAPGSQAFGDVADARFGGPGGALHFYRSPHVAIDNCSWLSLAVDYEALPGPVYTDGLARCLEFTVLAFARQIVFGGRAYYGAHYFLDGFEDRYIAASDLQTESYHLEATTGLILGLLAFADHAPSHPKASFFRDEADALWSGVQAFVVDHGFPYSSQRIIDLSTQLTSSTALIWFIDVYDALNAPASSVLCPFSACALRTALATSPSLGVVELMEATEDGEVKIPSWIRKNARWWADRVIEDEAFLTGIRYLLTQKVIEIPKKQGAAPGADDQTTIPEWVRERAGWWADGHMSDAEFAFGIEWLMGAGILVLDPVSPTGFRKPALEFRLNAHGALDVEEHHVTLEFLEEAQSDGWVCAVDGGRWLEEPMRVSDREVLVRVDPWEVVRTMAAREASELLAELRFGSSPPEPYGGCGDDPSWVQEVRVVATEPATPEARIEAVASGLQDSVTVAREVVSVAETLRKAYAELPRALRDAGDEERAFAAETQLAYLARTRDSHRTLADTFTGVVEDLRSGKAGLTGGDSPGAFEAYGHSQDELAQEARNVTGSGIVLQVLSLEVWDVDFDALLHAWRVWHIADLDAFYGQLQMVMRKSRKVSEASVDLPEVLRGRGCMDAADEVEGLLLRQRELQASLEDPMGDVQKMRHLAATTNFPKSEGDRLRSIASTFVDLRGLLGEEVAALAVVDGLLDLGQDIDACQAFVSARGAPGARFASPLPVSLSAPGGALLPMGAVSRVKAIGRSTLVPPISKNVEREAAGLELGDPFGFGIQFASAQTEPEVPSELHQTFNRVFLAAKKANPFAAEACSPELEHGAGHRPSLDRQVVALCEGFGPGASRDACFLAYQNLLLSGVSRVLLDVSRQINSREAAHPVSTRLAQNCAVMGRALWGALPDGWTTELRSQMTNRSYCTLEALAYANVSNLETTVVPPGWFDAACCEPGEDCVVYEMPQPFSLARSTWLAADFDGQGGYVEIPDHDAYSRPEGGALTVEAWIRPQSLVFPTAEMDGYVHWCGKGEVPGQRESACRIYSLDNIVERKNRVSWYMFNPPGGLGVGSYFQDDLVAGEWIYYVGTVDMTHTAIYRDGVLRDRAPLDWTKRKIVINPENKDSPFRIGTRDAGNNSYFYGAIARFAIYQGTLSDAQIREHYLAVGTAAYDDLVLSEPSVVGYWPLDEQSGSVAIDLKGGNHGTYHGGVTLGVPWTP